MQFHKSHLINLKQTFFGPPTYLHPTLVDLLFHTFVFFTFPWRSCSWSHSYLVSRIWPGVKSCLNPFNIHIYISMYYLMRTCYLLLVHIILQLIVKSFASLPCMILRAVWDSPPYCCNVVVFIYVMAGQNRHTVVCVQSKVSFWSPLPGSPAWVYGMGWDGMGGGVHTRR